MNRLNISFMASGLLGVALATSAAAQESQENFPEERSGQTSCQDVNWNANMLDKHPRLIQACQEVVLVDGEPWARFHAKFKKMEDDGSVIFSIQDRRDRPVEEMRLVPRSGQVAYIDDEATPFNELEETQFINLYVPEGEYGFATRAGAPSTRIATVSPRNSDQTDTRQASRPAVLPATASSLPWFAVAGFLSLLGGLILTIRRLN